MFEAPDGFELADCFSVAWPIHRFFRRNQSVHRQRAKLHALDFNVLTGQFEPLVGADALNFAEAIQMTQVCVEVEALEVRCVFRRQFRGLAAGRYAMRRTQVRDGSWQGQQVGRREVAADVDVLGDVRAAELAFWRLWTLSRANWWRRSRSAGDRARLSRSAAMSMLWSTASWMASDGSVFAWRIRRLGLAVMSRL